jgi:Flp pilus assembly protein TadD
MLAAMDQKAVLEKMQEAEAALDRDDTDAALALGRTLVEARFSGGFEIVARAHLQAGRGDAAIQALQEGTRVAPAAWPLWGFLGSLLGQAKRYDEAIAAFVRAAECPGARRRVLAFDHAVALASAGRLADAFSVAESAVGADGNPEAPGLLLEILQSLGRNDEAVSRGRAFLTSVGDDDPGRAKLLSTLARAELETGDRTAATAHVAEAIRLDRRDPGAAWVVRALRAQKSPTACRIRLTVAGAWPEPSPQGEPLGFLSLIHVIADSPEHALELAREFERPEVAPTLTIDSAQIGDPQPDRLVGVYQVDGRVFFPAKPPGSTKPSPSEG